MAILTRTGPIDEFDNHVVTDSLDMFIAPGLESVRPGEPASFFSGLYKSAAAGMRLNLVGWAIHDVSAAAVGFPAGDGGRCEAFVRVCDAPVVLLPGRVFGRAGRRIAAI